MTSVGALKGPCPDELQKGVVHRIPCAECPQTYIGQTGRSLEHRLHEHCCALKNGDVAASAIAEHLFSANHQVKFHQATVIDAHPHTQTCCMLESWHNSALPGHGHPQQREGHHARTLCITSLIPRPFHWRRYRVW